MRGCHHGAAWMPACCKEHQLGSASATRSGGSRHARCHLLGRGAPCRPWLLTRSGCALRARWCYRAEWQHNTMFNCIPHCRCNSATSCITPGPSPGAISCYPYTYIFIEDTLQSAGYQWYTDRSCIFTLCCSNLMHTAHASRGCWLAPGAAGCPEQDAASGHCISLNCTLAHVHPQTRHCATSHVRRSQCVLHRSLIDM